jgi:hypothetical protein
LAERGYRIELQAQARQVRWRMVRKKDVKTGKWFASEPSGWYTPLTLPLVDRSAPVRFAEGLPSTRRNRDGEHHLVQCRCGAGDE